MEKEEREGGREAGREGEREGGREGEREGGDGMMHLFKTSLPGTCIPPAHSVSVRQLLLPARH